MISTSIKLDGEAEFKKQLGDVNSNLRTLDSSMKLVTEEFKGQANSLDALQAKDKILTDQIFQQEEKVRALNKALEDASEVYADQPKKLDAYEQSLNRAKTELVKMQREQEDVNRYLKEARSSADKAAHSIDGFGREVEESDNSLDSYSERLKGFIGDLGKIKGAIAGGAAIGAIKELGGAILEVEESTREYRTIMGTLETSSQQLGYTSEETAELFEKLYGVLGDEQTAATAAANLQALELSQEDLMNMTDLAIGAWGRYGDSIPIDGLAESINETIKAKEVTGVFADVLNWAGDITEEEFNTALANAKDITERTDLVMQLMAEQGLADAAQAFYELKEDVIKANNSELELKEAWAKLGEELSPVADWIRGTLAGAVVWLTEKVDGALKALKDLKDWWDGAKSIWSEAGGLKGLFSWETLSKTPAELEAEAKAARTTQGLTGAELRERGITSADVYAASAAGAQRAMAASGAGSEVGMVHTQIVIGAREVADAITPALRDIDKSNPEVVSDPL